MEVLEVENMERVAAVGMLVGDEVGGREVVMTVVTEAEKLEVAAKDMVAVAVVWVVMMEEAVEGSTAVVAAGMKAAMEVHREEQQATVMEVVRAAPMEVAGAAVMAVVVMAATEEGAGMVGVGRY